MIDAPHRLVSASLQLAPVTPAWRHDAKTADDSVRPTARCVAQARIAQKSLAAVFAWMVADRMRIGLLSIVIVLILAAAVGAIVASHRLPASEATVEQQAQVPAPMGAMWCKSADDCPRRHVRRPD